MHRSPAKRNYSIAICRPFSITPSLSPVWKRTPQRRPRRHATPALRQKGGRRPSGCSWTRRGWRSRLRRTAQVLSSGHLDATVTVVPHDVVDAFVSVVADYGCFSDSPASSPQRTPGLHLGGVTAYQCDGDLVRPRKSKTGQAGSRSAKSRSYNDRTKLACLTPKRGGVS